MKLALLVLVALLVVAASGIAQTAYYYGKDGQAAGSVRTAGGTTYFYDADRCLQGSARTSGGTTYLYGARPAARRLAQGGTLSPRLPLPPSPYR